jgi:AAA15 family ATPase/GTPase
MLVEFRVKNFRSFRDEQVLSLVASKDKTLLDTNTLSTDIKAAPHLLRSAVIYGANASGKSNLIKALQYMRLIVLESGTLAQPGKEFNVQPFRFDKESLEQSSEFEVIFILDGVRHQYGFAMTPQRIVAEYLLVYKTAKPQCWFYRHFDESTAKDVYDFGSHLKGAKNVWEKATRPNALFLSTAVMLNSEALRPVFDWLSSDLVVVNEHAEIEKQFSIQALKQDEDRKRILDLLSAADTGITDIEVKTRKVSGTIAEIEKHQLLFTHVSGENRAVFDLMDESAGTRRLFFFAGPVLDILNKGRTLIVDELDTSLHPHLVLELVRLFYRPEINTGGAQLIFTTHDASLLDAYGLFRRDQIWFAEKEADQSSTLYSLLDFSPRKDEAIGRGYLQGRYGAVPVLSGVFGDG